MKKVVLGFLVFVSIFMVGCFETDPNSGASQAQAAAESNSNTAVISIPIPEMEYFQERRTVAKWALFWDKPNLPTYVYLFVYGNCIGYYVADGKPASTRSYLVPEVVPTRMNIVNNNGSNSYTVDMIQSPDLDGTYGDNNPGIRFFTSNGIPVEFGGSGASYLYSSSPLPLNVPELIRE
jgi:hypothetical protein